MYFQSLDQIHGLAWQISGPTSGPVLVYIPGIHGDWTPMWKIRDLLNQQLRLVEIAYPRAPEWSLQDYTEKLFDLFEVLNIPSAHLLAESFGSLVGWDFALKHPQRVRSLIVAGGFCSAPGRVRVRLARLAKQLVPYSLQDRCLNLFLTYRARKRLFTNDFNPQDFFPSSRTHRGHRAFAKRLKIIEQTDVRRLVDKLRLPVFYIGGSRDWIVPVNREVKHLQSCLHESCNFKKVILDDAPHDVIPARARDVSRLILDWTSDLT